MALKLPQGRTPSNRGPQPTPDRPVRRGDLREGCWTRLATGKTREERVSSAERRAARPAPTPPHPPPAGLLARPLARPLPVVPSGPVASARSEPPERKNGARIGVPPLLPAQSARARPLTRRLPRRSRTPLRRKAQPTAQTAPSPSERDCSKPGRQRRGRGREGQGAGSDVTRGGAGEVRPGQRFQSAPGTPDFRLGRGDWARFLAGEGSA